MRVRACACVRARACIDAWMQTYIETCIRTYMHTYVFTDVWLAAVWQSSAEKRTVGQSGEGRGYVRVCMNVCPYECMYVCTNECKYVCVYACLYVRRRHRSQNVTVDPCSACIGYSQCTHEVLVLRVLRRALRVQSSVPDATIHACSVRLAALLTDDERAAGRVFPGDAPREPSPGADVAGVSPVPEQMWLG